VGAEADGQEEEEEEIGAEGEKAGGIVPAMGGGEPRTGREGAEEDGAQAIREEGEGDAAGEQGAAGGKAEVVELTEEPSHHEGRLEGTDAAAGFLDTEGAAGDGDEVSAADGGDTEPMQDFERNGGIGRHENGRGGFLEETWPGGGSEEEEGRPGKVLQPDFSTGGSEVLPAGEDGKEGESDADESPLGIGFADQPGEGIAQGKQDPAGI
jgi:hypothetical protein